MKRLLLLTLLLLSTKVSLFAQNNMLSEKFVEYYKKCQQKWNPEIAQSETQSQIPSSVDSLDKKESGCWVASWGKSLVRQLTPGEFTLFHTILGLPPIFSDGLTDRTIRQIVHLSTGGSKLRLRFQNQPIDSGTSTFVLNITQVNIAKQDAKQSIVPGTDTLVTFNGGSKSVQVYPGAEVISDPVDFKTCDLENLAVSMYFATSSGAPTALYQGLQTEYVAKASGNLNSAPTFDLDPANTPITGPLWLSGVDVLRKNNLGTLVCFGDSFTDGFCSTPDANLDYPSQLAKRLKNSGLGIINEGISGNQITSGGSLFGSSFVIFGEAALDRFMRDVLNQTDVKYILWLEGINDIIFSGRTSQQIINGMSTFIKQVRAARKDIKIFGGTITPFRCDRFCNWTPDLEKVREEVNFWIRNIGDFNAVVDFDKAIRDPKNPTFIRPDLVCLDNGGPHDCPLPPAPPVVHCPGDGEHPNDKGYCVMAKTAKAVLAKHIKSLKKFKN